MNRQEHVYSIANAHDQYVSDHPVMWRTSAQCATQHTFTSPASKSVLRGTERKQDPWQRWAQETLGFCSRSEEDSALTEMLQKKKTTLEP